MSKPVEELTLSDVPVELFEPLAEDVDSEDKRILAPVLLYLYAGAKARLGYPLFTIEEVAEREPDFLIAVALEQMRRRGQVEITPSPEGLFGEGASARWIGRPPSFYRVREYVARQQGHRLCYARSPDGEVKCRRAEGHYSPRYPHKWWDMNHSLEWLDKEA